MAYFVDEKTFINSNIFMHEERLSSQYARFLDKTPTYVTYYNINNVESTVDNGFENIEDILGPNSPLKFKEIKDFPIYGIDQIIPDLSTDDYGGIDSNYEGEAIILPDGIKPLPNDFFIISYLDKRFLFMVTAPAYQTIRSNSFYKINFMLKAVDSDSHNDLINQTNENYTCIVNNIGTKENYIIRDDHIIKLVELEKVYRNIAERYKLLFYNNRYNCFMYDDGMSKTYDIYLSHFINQNEIFKQKNDLNVLLLNLEDKSRLFLQEYFDTIFNAIENKDIDMVKDLYMYKPYRPTDIGCIFRLYRDVYVKCVGIPDGGFGNLTYLSDDICSVIKHYDGITDVDIKHKIIHNYMNDKIVDINDIDLDSLKGYNTYLKYDMESMLLVPVLLFILKKSYHSFMALK